MDDSKQKAAVNIQQSVSQDDQQAVLGTQQGAGGIDDVRQISSQQGVSAVDSGLRQGGTAPLADERVQPSVSSVLPPVGLSHKEAEPLPRPQVEQHVAVSEHQIELSQELKEAGVERAKDEERPEISQEAKEAGVEHAKESVYVEPQKMPVIQLPLYKREEVLPHAQNGPVTDAARWFYTFLLRQIDKVKKQELT